MRARTTDFVFSLVALIVVACRESIVPIKTASMTPLESNDRAVRTVAVRALGAAGPTPAHVQAIVRSFRFETEFSLHGRPTGRSVQSEYLRAHPIESYPALIEGLHSGDRNVRRNCAFTLGEIGNVAAFEHLQRAFVEELHRADGFQLTQNALASELAPIRSITDAERRLDAGRTVSELLLEMKQTYQPKERSVVEDSLLTVVRPDSITFRCTETDRLTDACVDRWIAWWQKARDRDVFRPPYKAVSSDSDK